MKIGKYDFKIQWVKTGVREIESVDWLRFLEEYKKIVKKTDRVLEIGASTPARTKQLAQCCAELVGLELMPERLPKDFDNIKFKLGNWESLSSVFPEESFDVIVASHVIEHVEHDEPAIKELYKVLKKGGTAIIDTPNVDRVAARIEEFFKGKKVFPWFEHFREYNEKSMSELISKAPFKSFEITPICFGITGWKLFIYVTPVPMRFKDSAGFIMATIKK